VSTPQPLPDTSSSPAVPPSPAPASLGILVMALAPFGLGYFLSYLFRAVNAVVAPDLQAQIGLTAAELGLLTAAYLFAFAAFQLPLGVLLDRYGPRRVQVGLLTLAAVGAALFSVGSSVVSLTAARALIGIGFAGGLMSGFKAVVLWVPEPRRALANSLVMSLGAIGLLCATTPMEWAVSAAGWRTVFLGLAGVTFAAALLIWALVPERRQPASGETLSLQVAAIGAILRDRGFWGLAPLLGATAGTHIAIQTLWAGPWFRDVAGLDRIATANHLFLMAAAFFVGILVSGAVTDRLVRRGFSELDVMLGFLLLFLAAQACIILDIVPLRLPAWMVFGMSGQVAILAYPWLSKHFGAKRSGRANTAMNLIIFASAFLIQAAIGAIIDTFPKTPGGGYGPAAYQAAFGLFFALQLAALAWYWHQRPRA
jgi:predicted MFS family arabinose efflux permease